MEIEAPEAALCMAVGIGTAPLVVAPERAVATPTRAYLGVKRALDVVLSLVALLATAPIWIVVAVLVGCTSSGPILFRQQRVGRGGRLFTVLKFRSMCADAEARLKALGMYETYVAAGYKLHVADEFRVTKVGRFLRRTSLDELPQLINVLRGDMSLVGPRPVEHGQLSDYGDLVDCYLGVRPGITGIWQVSGRSNIHFPQRAHLDDSYFRRRSLRLDLLIMARTPLAVLRAEGAH